MWWVTAEEAGGVECDQYRDTMAHGLFTLCTFLTVRG